MLPNTTVVIWVTITPAHTGQSPVQTLPAGPIHIRDHRHIDVCTDINKCSYGW